MMVLEEVSALSIWHYVIAFSGEGVGWEVITCIMVSGFGGVEGGG